MFIFNRKNNNQFGFTLIEVLVVVAIVGILAAAVIISFANTRARSRDTAKLSDVKQIQTALHLYWQAVGVYPSTVEPGDSIEYGGNIFMSSVPAPPLPTNDGDCPLLEGEDLEYSYTTIGTGGSMTYQLEFCLAYPSGGLEAGTYVASPSGITLVE
jgi:prepilin-type N-terminal cleavage/methylation domain-containing protein